jgi:carbonic anhydrase/acetyltransferase-like protein (isoleucine patch superfamily)
MIRTFKSTRPIIDPSAYVDLSAQVIGDVHIGPESSVWMNVVIRGDVNHIRIGKRTNIQDLTMIHVMRDTHPTIIGDEVTVGHSAVVHGTTIEDRVLIGMGAVLLNGVHIEHDCVIAAGTLITEGTRIPSGSLVMGRPGKVKRKLTDEEIAEIRWYSDNYVNYRLDYSTETRVSKPLGFK